MLDARRTVNARIDEEDFHARSVCPFAGFSTIRFFTTARRFELRYGGSTEQALAVGKVLASEPA